VKFFASLVALTLVATGPVQAAAPDNRASALAFYDALIISKKGAAAAGKYLSPDFKSHSAGFPSGDAKTFLAPAEQAFKDPKSPIAQWQIEVLRTVAEKDLVVIHARGRADGKVYAIADIMRFDKAGKIVEHWDFVQDVTGSKNTAGAF
jgi:predicted SnoaL-like aldol condensation-catalyzing enzyme